MNSKEILILLILSSVISYGQTHSHAGAKAINYPNIEGYLTLKTDLHQHTVFSDGNVWPNIRVQEALRENLDAISLTEHLEYQPHKEDIPHPDRNRSYEIALEEAKEHELLIVHGSEITRSEPVGHSNAVFITNANPLLAEDAATPFAEAKKQNAFVFWNHPAWYAQRPKGNPVLSDFQKERIKNGELHGIEVINTFDYAEESLQIALDNNLTIMGTSDIHGLIDWDYTEKGMHRPITLVFVKERSIKDLREALFKGQTVAVYNELLVGKPEFLIPLIKASVVIKEATYLPESSVLKVTLENVSSSDLIFENNMPYTFYSKPPLFTIHAGKTIDLQIKTLETKNKINLELKAMGAYIAPKEHPLISWEIVVN